MTTAYGSATSATATAAGVRRHAGLFLIEGIILMLLGAAAILVPFVASVAVALLLGWLFLIGGGIGLVTTLLGRYAPGFWWALISALVTVGCGLLLLGWPVSGAISLTLVLTGFLLAAGVLMIAFALSHRKSLSQRWVGLLINGLMDLFLAALIILALPGAALWVLGLMIGIDLVFGGAALVAMATAARRAA